jgi:hypothetical protein
MGTAGEMDFGIAGAGMHGHLGVFFVAWTDEAKAHRTRDSATGR